MTQLANATVCITGAASGLGKRLAILLAREGANLLLWDLRKEPLDSAAEEVRLAGRQSVLAQAVDVTDREAVYAAALEARERLGRIGVLINNAGVVQGKPLLEADDDALARTMDVNVNSMFWTCKAFLPAMIEAGEGHVVTIASAAGLIGVARLTDYCASKWAAVGFDESLRAELRQAGSRVRTTVVCPHYINTGMFAGVRSRAPWLLPILDEEDTASRILRAIRRNRQRLVMPWIVGMVPMLRAFPLPLFDAVADLLGVNRAMTTFTGRKPSDRG